MGLWHERREVSLDVAFHGDNWTQSFGWTLGTGLAWKQETNAYRGNEKEDTRPLDAGKSRALHRRGNVDVFLFFVWSQKRTRRET